MAVCSLVRLGVAVFVFTFIVGVPNIDPVPLAVQEFSRGRFFFFFFFFFIDFVMPPLFYMRKKIGPNSRAQISRDVGKGGRTHLLNMSFIRP